MGSSKRFLLLTLVTVFGCCRHSLCASLPNGDVNWASRSVNLAERQGRQRSSSSNNNSNNYVNSNKRENSQSSFSIEPSVSYQFHTNDHEDLDNIVLAHQQNTRSGENSVKSVQLGAPSSDSSVIIRGENVVTEKITPGGVGSYPGFDLSMYQHQQQSQFSGSLQSELQQKYVSTGTQVGDNNNDVQSQLSSKAIPEAITGRKSEEIRNNSGWSVNARQDFVKPSRTPITSQGQQPQPQGYTAASGSYARIADSGKQNVGPLGSMGKQAGGSLTKEKTEANRKQILERRQDTVYGGDEGAPAAGDEEDEHLHYYDHGEEQYDGHHQESYQQQEHDHDQAENDNNEYYYGNGENGGAGEQQVADEDEEDPAIRDFSQGQPGGFEGPFVSGPGGAGGPFGGGPGGPFGGGPPGLPGPPGLGPLPPPPGPLKGSIDYILIPLILIGIAGPIFVVLYVILGGFEYKLAPIVKRSFKSSYSDYQPYIDSLTSTVGRALEKYECDEYAACRLRGFCNKLGLRSSNANSVERALRSVTPTTYMPTVSSFLALIKAKKPEEEGSCRSYQCASLVDQLPFKI